MSIDPFDPIAVARDVIGNLTDTIKATERDTSVPEPQGRTTFNTVLLLQAGLRALLPVEARADVALPKIFPSDAQELQDAQRNYAAVFESGGEATDEQRTAGLKAIGIAAAQLSEQGYKKVASILSEFKDAQASQRPQAPFAPPGAALKPELR